MPKKRSTSRSLVVAGQRKPSAKRRAVPALPVPATDTALLKALPSPSSAAKILGSGGELEREDGVTLITGRSYATRERIVPAEELYYDSETRPKVDGPWLGEADKIAWRDEATGYDCIVLRARYGGYLTGYVGIPSDHPLWGWDHHAIPTELGIVVHGGLTYSKRCEDEGLLRTRLAREARRICHVRTPPPKLRATGPDIPGFEDSDAWWLGFSCNHAYDLSPGESGVTGGFMRAEIGPQYRDDSYVVRETITLAAQLRAIAHGDRAPERTGPVPPPLGLDPKRGSPR